MPIDNQSRSHDNCLLVVCIVKVVVSIGDKERVVGTVVVVSDTKSKLKHL